MGPPPWGDTVHASEARWRLGDTGVSRLRTGMVGGPYEILLTAPVQSQRRTVHGAQRARESQGDTPDAEAAHRRVGRAGAGTWPPDTQCLEL